MGYLQALLAYRLPQADPDDAEALGTALFLEELHWERMTVAVQNAIVRAIRGNR